LVIILIAIVLVGIVFLIYFYSVKGTSSKIEEDANTLDSTDKDSTVEEEQEINEPINEEEKSTEDEQEIPLSFSDLLIEEDILDSHFYLRSEKDTGLLFEVENNEAVGYTAYYRPVESAEILVPVETDSPNTGAAVSKKLDEVYVTVYEYKNSEGIDQALEKYFFGEYNYLSDNPRITFSLFRDSGEWTFLMQDDYKNLNRFWRKNNLLIHLYGPDMNNLVEAYLDKHSSNSEIVVGCFDSQSERNYLEQGSVIYWKEVIEGSTKELLRIKLDGTDDACSTQFSGRLNERYCSGKEMLTEAFQCEIRCDRDIEACYTGEVLDLELLSISPADGSDISMPFEISYTANVETSCFLTVDQQNPLEERVIWKFMSGSPEITASHSVTNGLLVGKTYDVEYKCSPHFGIGDDIIFTSTFKIV
jgi:hypothetical protein